MKDIVENTSEEYSDSVIRLSLRKPKNWNWSVDNSSSSSTTTCPSIQIWDEDEGHLLVDTRYQVLSTVSDQMEKVNVNKQRTRSLKLPSVTLSNWLKDERSKIKQCNTDNLCLKDKQIKKVFSCRFKSDDQLKTPGRISQSEPLRKVLKAEKKAKTEPRTQHRYPLAQTENIHIPRIHVNVRKEFHHKEVDAESFIKYEKKRLTNLPLRSRKDTYIHTQNVKPNNVEQTYFHDKCKAKTNIIEQISTRSVLHKCKTNKNKESESNVKHNIESFTSQEKDLRAKEVSSDISKRTLHKYTQNKFKSRSPLSVDRRSLHKPSKMHQNGNAEEKNNIDKFDGSKKANIEQIKNNNQQTATRNVSFRKDLSLRNTKEVQRNTTNNPESCKKISRKCSLSKSTIKNDLQSTEMLTPTGHLRKHETLGNNQTLTLSTIGKTINTTYSLNKSEIKLHTHAKTSNPNPKEQSSIFDDQNSNLKVATHMKGESQKLNVIHNSVVNTKPTLLYKNEKTSSKNISGIPIKKTISQSKSIKDERKNNDFRNTNQTKDADLRNTKFDVNVLLKPNENTLSTGNLDLVGTVKSASNLQNTYRKVRFQTPTSSSAPTTTVLNKMGNEETGFKESKLACTCFREVKIDYKKQCNSTNKKKVFRKRVTSSHLAESLSSSSSENELTVLWNQSSKQRRSQKVKGDRLLAINGQCIRHAEEAKDLLRNSGDVVRLQLVRNGVGSQSLRSNRLDSSHDKEDIDMGSNVSRHSGKGLTGRRSQSSGNLCNGKIMRPSVGRFFSPCSRSGADNSVGPRDRYKFCGSLPNHLDAKDPDLDEMSETDDDSSYRNNNNVPVLNHQIKNKKNVELRLHPLVSKGTQHGHQDSVTNDQGYASERSPEEEIPPSLVGTCPVHHKPMKQQYPIITKNSTFTVILQKGTRGLGLSVTGGIETEERWPGLIRIKRLFPHQPAWQSGHLAQGDILIAANNTPLTGLTNYEALEVLRTTPTEVVLTVCRPPPEIQLLNAPSSTETAPAPPKRDPTSTSGLLLPLKRQESFGEFQITLKKVNGSLGFTLRKEDESVLGHYVRALVKEPALSDGRIKPGDKIVAVNNVSMSPMSHEEAVMFLRQCDEEVHLKLYRDPVQTPVLALSPTEGHRTFKPILRKEAQDMLSDLAVKKSLSPNDSTGSSTLSRLGRSSSPRKRRLTKTPSPDDQLNGGGSLSWSSEVLERIVPGNDSDKPSRPDSLNLFAKHKPHFQFASTVVVTEETGLSSDEPDSTSQYQIVEEAESPVGVGPLPSEPVSMPLVISSSSTGGFSYRNPAYRSANPTTSTSKTKGSMCEELPENRCSDNDLSGSASGGVEGSKSLLKWKGVVFSPEDRSNSVNSPEDSISQITETDEGSSNQVLVIELMRGWNSRLGFSLQQEGSNTVISAIHTDSVASRDGRLKPGDQLVMVNDESVERMSTSEVIDLLRRIRGVICITVWRKLKD